MSDSKWLFRFDSAVTIKYSKCCHFFDNRKDLNNQMRKALSKSEIINLIKAEKSFLKETFGVINIGLFGSYAKDQQTPDRHLIGGSSHGSVLPAILTDFE